MDFGKLLEIVQTKAADLITLGGKIHPYVGVVVAVFLGGLMIYLGFKAKAQRWEQEKKNAGEKISTEVGKDQQTTEQVLDQADKFFEEKKD